MRAGHGVDDVQRADAVGDGERAETAAARVAVGSEGGGVLARGADVLDRALDDLIVELEDVVAGHAEDMSDAGRV